MKDNFCCVEKVMSRIEISWAAFVKSDDTVKKEEQFFFKNRLLKWIGNMNQIWEL